MFLLFDVVFGLPRALPPRHHQTRCFSAILRTSSSSGCHCLMKARTEAAFTWLIVMWPYYHLLYEITARALFFYFLFFLYFFTIPVLNWLTAAGLQVVLKCFRDTKSDV